MATWYARRREARGRRGLTQQEVAARAAVSLRTVNGYERGAVRAGRDTLLKLATVLELDRYTLEQALSQNASLALQMIRTTFDRVRANDHMTIRELRQAFETLERLDKAKLDEGKVRLECVSFPLHDLLADSMEITATLAAQKGLGKCDLPLYPATSSLFSHVRENKPSPNDV